MDLIIEIERAPKLRSNGPTQADTDAERNDGLSRVQLFFDEGREYAEEDGWARV
jgi:hypothetical protein